MIGKILRLNEDEALHFNNPGDEFKLSYNINNILLEKELNEDQKKLGQKMKS